MTTTFDDPVRMNSILDLHSINSIVVPINRSLLLEESFAEYVQRLEDFRVHNAMHTLLPAAGASPSLGLLGTAFGTDVPSLQTEDLKAAGASTRYARFTFTLPPEYIDASGARIAVHAGMITTISDTTATVDIEAFKSNHEGAVSGSDLCTTAAQSINSTTPFTTKNFELTGTSLVSGDTIDVRVAIAINDAATGTAVIGAIGKLAVLLDIQG